jgi:prevent-host-death family protein
MSDKEIGVFEAKTHLSDIIKRVIRGERFYITRRGVRVAILGPAVEDKTPLKRGCAKNDGFSISEDFDEPLEDLGEYM